MVVSWKGNGSFDCPHCGATVLSNAKMCRHCGSDSACGWDDDSLGSEWSLDSDDDFDYDDFVAREFPNHSDPATPPPRNWGKFIMLLVIVSLLLSMLF